MDHGLRTIFEAKIAHRIKYDQLDGIYSFGYSLRHVNHRKSKFWYSNRTFISNRNISKDWKSSWAWDRSVFKAVHVIRLRNHEPELEVSWDLDEFCNRSISPKFCIETSGSWTSGPEVRAILIFKTRLFQTKNANEKLSENILLNRNRYAHKFLFTP